MRIVFALTLIIISFVFISSSCSKGGGGGGGTTLDCNTVANKAFAANVNPIIQSSCAIGGCHDAISTNGPGPLTNYSQVFNARTTIRSDVSTGIMPKTGSLTSSQKNSIICWIDSGAPNN